MMEFQPIKPFEPIRADVIPNGPDWVHQVKWDGVRLLAYCNGQKVRLFNRRQHERTLHYPELVSSIHASPASSLILDGEVIALDPHGRPSFHEIMKRDRTTPTGHAKATDSIRVFYMVFDLLYVNGDWLNSCPLSDRIERLQQWLPLSDAIHFVPVYDNGDALFAGVKEKHMEGIVSKKRNSRYGIGGKNGNWRKIKVTEDLIAVVGAVTYRNGRVNALLIGQYDLEHRLIYIGRVGSGTLTSQDWQAVTRLAELLKSQTNPFERQPENVKKVSWLIPKLTVKVEFQEWTENGSLRQPRILAFVDENPHRCILEEGSNEGNNFQ
ncbi:RNA ligase family protein [Sporolactobacillus terrae]|uniref:DNA ligase (ATP) n=2 Tax=Sporolactobacillus terrae TaxID=269673 RepID=A0A5K7X075_9BACL|nr:RNA ligase family protein [Sporolactobacillus terrae]BBN99364.1 hypothetical protein St703_20690 [Sporolactobacillus terrae]